MEPSSAEAVAAAESSSCYLRAMLLSSHPEQCSNQQLTCTISPLWNPVRSFERSIPCSPLVSSMINSFSENDIRNNSSSFPRISDLSNNYSEVSSCSGTCRDLKSDSHSSSIPVNNNEGMDESLINNHSWLLNEKLLCSCRQISNLTSSTDNCEKTSRNLDSQINSRKYFSNLVSRKVGKHFKRILRNASNLSRSWTLLLTSLLLSICLGPASVGECPTVFCIVFKI